ncbi:ATP-dependent DNA helicase PcrA [Clostridium aceticum]|uniref:ATP-dependent DNA helicase n=1 Tax=Clostridium aceticum TaxID=84022 RepID=A0A0D8IEY3_9CLOT|nr:DNA helicase PcrA [Clostridium aceticum]AKL93967.1 ATP-dependent DNA helicase PcrA [Clostridium aceticum]KJF28649.1 ATP-dependent DNA helicase PcrA [Clostridium aceticum]
MNLNHLNDMQRKAVEHTEGPLLVLAGAGSGKTRVLTHRIAYLVEEKGVSPYSVLAITFTNKAAREMKERLENLMGDSYRDLWVSTFHSACMRILRMDIEKVGYQKNFVVYDTSDQLTVMKDCVKKLNLDEKYFNPRAVLGAIGKAKDQLIGPEEFIRIHGSDFRDAKIGELYKMYQKTLKNNNALDFDDLIMKTVELFNQDSTVLHYYHNKFKYILVDEFQDTNMAQYTLVSMLAKQHKNLCVVGDDDQSIYGWRGADIQNILGFEKDFPGAEVIKLEKNYRSTKTILEAANKVVVNNAGRKDKKLWTDNVEGEIIQYYRANNEYDEASYIAGSIETLRKQENHLYSDFAILYRTNAQSRVLEEELMKRGVPYKIFSGTRFYDRKEIKDILAYLTIVENPVDDVSIKRIINVPKRGIGLKTIEKIEAYGERLDIRFFEALLDIEEIGEVSGKVQKQIKKFTNMIIGIREKKEEMGVTEIVQELYEKTGYIDALKEEDRVEADSRIENLNEFLSLTMDFDKNAEIKTLEEFLARTSLESNLDGDDEEEDAVVLMTLHSAKGLEFPVVFMPGMEEGIFPSYMSMQEKNEEEERRLCYVGITRAMKKLYMSHAMMRTLYGRTSYNSCSRFLEEIPQELITKEKVYKRKEEVKKMQTSPLFTGGGLPGIQGKPKLDTTTVKKKVRTGDKINHPTFGLGTVVAAGGEILTIAFPSVGVKKIATTFLQLDVVE